jgi:hypothetical protein
VVEVPGPVRTLVAAVRDGVAAAGQTDAATFDEAVGWLAGLDPALVAEVLGGAVRSLLEEKLPDGLDGEDLRTVLADCTRSAAWAGVDPGVLVVVLTGALGLSAEDQPTVPPAAVARHALLLVAHLTGGTPPAAHLDAALAELARAQTVEMP